MQNGARTSTTFGSNRDMDRKNLVTQGLVTMNCGDGKEIVENRRQNSTEQYRFASGNMGVIAMDGHAIRPFELMLAYREMTKTANRYQRNHVSRSMVNFVPECFTTFNGIKKQTRADFRKQLVPLGFAADFHVYGEPAQMDVGVAAIVSGSFTTTNTGTEMFTPGMLLKWSPPPMDAADPASIDKRTKKFQEKRVEVGAVSPAEPIDRFPAVLEPFDFNRDVARVVGDKLLEAQNEIVAGVGVLISDKPSDAVAFWKKKMAADLRTFLLVQKFYTKLPGDQQRQDFIGQATEIATSGSYANVPQDVTVLSNALYSAYDPASNLPDDDNMRKLTVAQDGGIATSFGIECAAIHEAMQQVVCKSIGFSLAGAGADVVV